MICSGNAFIYMDIIQKINLKKLIIVLSIKILTVKILILLNIIKQLLIDLSDIIYDRGLILSGNNFFGITDIKKPRFFIKIFKITI